ncbi:MAG TPA: hypothetical protein VIG33_03815 [Pseudobdellovibrionaceae bacterium]|jgi:hypothetical protein
MKIVLTLLTLVAFYVFTLLHDAGVFRRIKDVKYGQCQKIGPALGPEDMVLTNTKAGVKVLVSSDARTTEAASGHLYEYDLQNRHLRDMTSELNLPFPFHPHGMDLWTEGTGKTLVYVVNHMDELHTRIEVFEWGPEIVFVKSIENELFQSGNDLVAIGNDRFYLTSDFGTPNKFQQKLQSYLWQKTGYVTHYDGNTAKKIANNLFYANGITKGFENRIFVSAMLEKAVHILEGEVIPLEGAPDNITWYQEKLYIAAHANLFALKKESEDRKNRAPSKIIEWDGKKATTIYENAGDEISSASIALPIDENRLLIGSVFDNHILDCTRSKP